MRLSTLLLLASSLLISRNGYAEVPSECLQAPQREAVCPHTLYRVARVPVPSLAINKGNMVCLCLSDLTDVPAPEQQAAFTDIAKAYSLPPLALYQLLELSAPRWAITDKP